MSPSILSKCFQVRRTLVCRAVWRVSGPSRPAGCRPGYTSDSQFLKHNVGVFADNQIAARIRGIKGLSGRRCGNGQCERKPAAQFDLLVENRNSLGGVQPQPMKDAFGTILQFGLDSRVSRLGLSSDLGDAKAFAYLSDKPIGNLCMSGHRFHPSGQWIYPERVRTSLSFEVTAMMPEVPEEIVSFHPTATTSLVASDGRPRRASSRRSAKIKSIASARL